MNKKSLWRSGLALVLVLCMVLSMCPVKVAAAEVTPVQKLLSILEKNGLELNGSEVASGTGKYSPTGNSKYVALGDGSAKNGYPEKVAAELGIEYENMAKDQLTVEAQLKDLSEATNKKKIEKADLVSIGFGNVTCVNEAINGVLGSGSAVNWSKYVADEDAIEIQKIIDELVLEITGKSSDMISKALNAFAFSFVSYIYGMNELIDTVHAINPNALLLVVGMHNPLNGVVFEMAGIKLDISDSLDDLVKGANGHIAGYCASVENVVFVNAPDVATINTNTNIGLKKMAELLSNECADFNPSDAGHTYIKDQIMKSLVISERPVDPQGNVIRLAGNSKYETSFAIANEMKKVLGVDKFDAVVLANSDNFADALAGSYLAAVKKAPIIITKAKYAQLTCDYLNENLSEGASIYVLGGVEAMPGNILDTLEVNAMVTRLEGEDRYGTNLAILDEAGIEGKDLLIATGRDFADSLSASATGLPILLVNGKAGKHLTAEQKNLLKNVEGGLFVIGGESAVPAALVAEIEAAAGQEVTRIAGESRYETSVEIAAEFLSDATGAVVAYASTFPDGLCGGPLANVKGAPLLLTKNGKTEAPAYTAANGITSGYVLGGVSLISDDMANRIFK